MYGDIVLRVQDGDTIQFRDQNHHPYMKLSSGVALDTRLSLSWESWDAADAWLDWLRGEFDDARRLAVERWERAHPVEAEMRRVDEARYDAQHGLGAPTGDEAA